MKRTLLKAKKGFKKKTWAELFEKKNSFEEALKKGRKALKRAKKPLKTRRPSKDKYYKQLLSENTWLKAIPPNISHGRNPTEQRLWRVNSDYSKIRDFVRDKKCMSCNKVFENWQDAQGGHFRAFNKCKGYTKYSYVNVFAQCAFCNSRMNDDKFETGRIFANNIVLKFGQSYFDYMNNFTNYSYDERVEVPGCIERIKAVLILMNDLPIKPDYYHKVMTQMSN